MAFASDEFPPNGLLAAVRDIAAAFGDAPSQCRARSLKNRKGDSSANLADLEDCLNAVGMCCTGVSFLGARTMMFGAASSSNSVATSTEDSNDTADAMAIVSVDQQSDMNVVDELARLSREELIARCTSLTHHLDLNPQSLHGPCQS